MSYSKEWYSQNKEEVKARNRINGKANNWYSESRDPEKRRITKQKSYENKKVADPLFFSKRNKLFREKVKREVIALMGDKCVCCGEKEIDFLTIDHINNDGAAHRKNLLSEGLSSQKIWTEIRRTGKFIGFQLMCSNCNLSKHIGNGVCIHKRRS